MQLANEILCLDEFVLDAMHLERALRQSRAQQSRAKQSKATAHGKQTNSAFMRNTRPCCIRICILVVLDRVCRWLCEQNSVCEVSESEHAAARDANVGCEQACCWNSSSFAGSAWPRGSYEHAGAKPVAASGCRLRLCRYLVWASPDKSRSSIGFVFNVNRCGQRKVQALF
jgi:hypothetical protein